MWRNVSKQKQASGTADTPAIVMNLFYTGLGIARSLGERGVPVIGLTSRCGVYGNFTRYAKVVLSPDSRERPEELLAFLLDLAARLGRSAVIFPTRDDDLVFLDRFRRQLEPHFRLVAPDHAALNICLSKMETHGAAERAGIAAPRCWLIEDREDLSRAAAEVTYPCVLKPLSSHHWRQGGNWRLVGARKAIGIHSERELLAEYDTISRADKRAVLQEMVPGGDECLTIVACYLDRRGRWVAGFNTQKLVQVPEDFGTGCVVQSVERPELFAPTARLLESIGFQGIAEVEYKWDAAAGVYKLIEINPRPWDQHRLGNACGVELMNLAYADHAGLPVETGSLPVPGQHKWIAEDTFATTALRLLWRRDPGLRRLFRNARGQRVYAIWSSRDPLPLVVYVIAGLLPELLSAALSTVRWVIQKRIRRDTTAKEGLVYDNRLEKNKTIS
jgi:predicted ATP-grasp superfamily ATP-dependent carboligase